MRLSNQALTSFRGTVAGSGGSPDPHQTYRLFENEILTSTGSYIIFYTTTWEIYAQLL